VLGIRTNLCVYPVLLASLLSMSMARQQAGEGQGHGLTYQFSGLAHQTSTSFELNGHKIYVPVRINSKGPYWFILDTGSVSDVVDTETAKSLGIALSGRFEASGGGEKTIEGAVGAHVSLRIAGLELKHRRSMSSPSTKLFRPRRVARSMDCWDTIFSASSL